MLGEWVNVYINEWVNIANQISYFCYPKIKEKVLQRLTLSSTLLYIRLTSISNSCPDAIPLPLKKIQSGNFNLFALQIISFSSLSLQIEKELFNLLWCEDANGETRKEKKVWEILLEETKREEDLIPLKNQPSINNCFCLLKRKSKTNLT